MNKIMMTVGFVALSVNSTIAFGFPEMIRHNYVNCTSCHISPNGGGVLNAYGRQSSSSVLSTWGTEDEAKPFYNLFTQPDWIDTGAFARTVQTAKNNSSVSSGYFWKMQAELEGAVNLDEGKWTFDLTLGINPDALNGLLRPGDYSILSRRHYAMYRWNDSNSIRAGKFLLDYGVYFADHAIATRQGIGFDEGSETYNIEYGYQGENWSGSLTANFGRLTDSRSPGEKGGAATLAYNLSDHSKVGWSSYFGTQNGNSRELIGPYALLGFTPHFYFLGEVDLQWVQQASGNSMQGLFTYERLGYEWIQGLHFYLMQQTFVNSMSGSFQPIPQQLKYGGSTNRLTGIGSGVYWYPRPHFYFQLEVQQQFSAELPSSQTSGFITGNVYL